MPTNLIEVKDLSLDDGSFITAGDIIYLRKNVSSKSIRSSAMINKIEKVVVSDAERSNTYLVTIFRDRKSVQLSYYPEHIFNTIEKFEKHERDVIENTSNGLVKLVRLIRLYLDIKMIRIKEYFRAA